MTEKSGTIRPKYTSMNNIPFYQKIKAIVNYWRFSFWINSKWSQKQIIGKVGFLELLLYPIGYIFFKMIEKFYNESIANY